MNCDAALPEGARFCPGCSQRADTARLSIGDMLRESMHSFLNIERGPLAMLRGLLTRPGRIARDYVDGRRRRYYGPFAMLVVLVGTATLMVNVAGYELLAHDGFGEATSDILQHHFNLLLLVQLPLLGALCAVVFRTDSLTLPEHMVLVAYTLSMRTVVTMVTMPLALMLNASAAPTPAQVNGFWLAWYLYFAWAATQFYTGRRVATFCKGLAAALLGHIALVALVRLGTLAVVRAIAFWGEHFT
ncbi:MAG: DUF3667 domain-containing protein [Caldimonas sp.]